MLQIIHSASVKVRDLHALISFIALASHVAACLIPDVSIIAATVFTDHPAAEGILRITRFGRFSCHASLACCACLRNSNCTQFQISLSMIGRMSVFKVELREFPGVFHPALCERVRVICLLAPRITHVLFIGEHLFDCAPAPRPFVLFRGHSLCRQFVCNRIVAIAVQKLLINPPDNDGLFLVDYQVPISVFVIPQELPTRDALHMPLFILSAGYPKRHCWTVLHFPPGIPLRSGTAGSRLHYAGYGYSPSQSIHRHAGPLSSRMQTRQSKVFRPKRDTDLVMIRSSFPSLQSFIILWKAGRLLMLVPEIPSSA